MESRKEKVKVISVATTLDKIDACARLRNNGRVAWSTGDGWSELTQPIRTLVPLSKAM